MLALGAGVGLFYSSITTQAVTALDPSRASLARGIVCMFQVAARLACRLGIASAVFTARAGDGLNRMSARRARLVPVRLPGDLPARRRPGLAGLVVTVLFVGRPRHAGPEGERLGADRAEADEPASRDG